MFQRIHKLLSSFIDQPHCLLCGTNTGLDFCAACHSDLPWNNSACHRCTLPLPSPDQEYCATCISRPSAFDCAVTALRYEFPVDALIRRFKYEEALYLARPLATLLFARIQESALPLPGAILPVPLHVNRFKERGFNQSLEIARYIARELKIPLATCVTRKIDTAHQSGLNAKQRRKNLRSAFSLNQEHVPPSIAIVDDVMTTGTTVSTISKLLRRAGVQQILIWSVARAGNI